MNPKKEDKENPTRKTKKKKKGVQCYNCEKRGHLAKNYWYKKGKNEGENHARQDSSDSEGIVVMIAVANEHVNTKIWFLNTCCSNHMSGQKVWLEDLDESKKSKVKLVDNSLLQQKVLVI